jgi:hypothetical protein
MIFRQTQTQFFEFETKTGFGRNDLFSKVSSQTVLENQWRWGAACSMPRVYDIDDTYGISARPRLVVHFARVACQMQVMRVWSLLGSLAIRVATGEEQ